MQEKLKSCLSLLDQKLKTHRHQVLMAVGLICICIIVVRLSSKDSPIQSSQQAAYESLETFIPFGFTLVPIEVINLQQLQSMISDRAVVDLFLENSNLPAAEAVRLVRSPVDPNVFGVLVEEEKTKPLLQQGHQFIVVIKNRNSAPRKRGKFKKRTIVFEEAT